MEDYVLKELSKKIVGEEVRREKGIRMDDRDGDGLVLKKE